MKKIVPFFIILIVVCVFFWQFFLKGFLPIPSDNIIGLYHPFRDLYAQDYPRGVTYKNFLLTDPVRQQYPWKKLATSLEKNSQLPLWNPYEMAGTPLLANFQSSPFYPLSIILFIQPFHVSWSVFIFLEPLLAGLFLYLYLRNLKLDPSAALLGAVTWAFCGFSIAWMEWGTVVHTALWLPFILLSIDKLVFFPLEHKSNIKYEILNLHIKNQILWGPVFIFSLCSSFLAGHLQTFFYVFVFSGTYLLLRLAQYYKKIFNILFVFLLFYILFLMLTFLQWYPTFQFILLSNRSLDQSWMQVGWFIPWQNLIQFIAPDFFGNPATLNYWGIWNYGEFIGYVGISGLILALYAVFFRHDRKTWFFGALTILALLFATPNALAKLPYILKIPFIATAQPTRLLFIGDISLAVLAALGFDYLLKTKKHIWIPILVIGFLLVGLWATVFLVKQFFPSQNDLLVSKNNLKLPSVLFLISSLAFLLFEFVKDNKMRKLLTFLILVLVLFDLFRFGWKFTPFTSPSYLFPNTKTISFLQKQPGLFRIGTADSRIFPPNFSTLYKLQSIEGYDPLYLQNYAELIAANERSDHSIEPPFGFNRIITPRNLDTQVIDVLNVKYVLSIDELSNPKFKKVFEEGQTKVYENTHVFPRAFFVEDVLVVPDRNKLAELMFEKDLSKIALATGSKNRTIKITAGSAHVLEYSPNRVVIQTENAGSGFLVFSDVYYPIFHATIDGMETEILETDLALRGIEVPPGKHQIVFELKLF